MLACMAGFRRGIEAVNLDQGSSVPLGFVCELPGKLTPSHIADSFRKAVVLDHVLDCQTLDADHLVFVNNAGGELMLIVAATIIDTSTHTGYFKACFLPVLRSLFCTCMPSLSFCQLLLILCKEFGIANTLTGGEDDYRLDPQIQTNHVGRWRQWLDLLFNQERDKIAICTILGDRDRTGLGVLGKISMEVDIQRSIHLGKSELFDVGVPLECVCSICGRLAILPLLECWVLGTTLKEVLKGSIQVTERLLNRDGRGISQPGVLLLEVRQHGGKIIVEELFTMFFVGSRAGMQPPIVDEANTSKRLSQDDPLLISRVEAKFISPFRLAHSLLVLLQFLDMLCYCRQDLSVERAIVLFGHLSYLFQQMRGKPDGESLYIIFHAAIVTLKWLYVNGLWYPVLQPQTRNASYIPTAEAEGFTARFDNQI